MRPATSVFSADVVLLRLTSAIRCGALSLRSSASSALQHARLGMNSRVLLRHIARKLGRRAQRRIALSLYEIIPSRC